jgi:hypothetical protein
MKMRNGLALWVVACAAMACAASARADNFVFGTSSGFSSQSPPPGIYNGTPLIGDQLILTMSDGSTEYAPLGTNSFFSTDFPLAPTTFGAWFSNTGVASGPANDDYIVGNLTQPNLLNLVGIPDEAAGSFRSVLMYNLNGVNKNLTVTGAVEFLNTFTIKTPGVETVNLYDVTTPVATVFSYPDPNAGGTAIYNDLGTGKLYGSYNYTAAMAGTYQPIPLSAAAIFDLNNVLAGFVPSDFYGDPNMLVFPIGHTDVASVPVPSALMAGAVLVAGLWVGRLGMRRLVAVRV